MLRVERVRLMEALQMTRTVGKGRSNMKEKQTLTKVENKSIRKLTNQQEGCKTKLRESRDQAWILLQGQCGLDSMTPDTCCHATHS